MNPSKVLEVWEKCTGRNNLYCGLSLASITEDSLTIEEVADWSLEKRDFHLFQLRKALFGEKFVNVAACPNCEDRVEWTMDFEQFQISELPDTFDDVEYIYNNTDFNINYRLPTSNDLATNRESKIIENCIISCKKGDKKYNKAKIPEHIKEELVAHMEQKSPVSNILLSLNCSHCDHQWNLTFDIIGYLLAEIDQWAKLFLKQVFVLAKAFGWSESSIIEMSPTRRNYYLNLLNS